MSEYSKKQLAAVTAFAEKAQAAAAQQGYGAEARHILNQVMTEFDVHPAAKAARSYAKDVIRGVDLEGDEDLETLGTKLLDAAFRAGYDHCHNEG